MREITPTDDMIKAAIPLNEGDIMVVYNDNNAIRMETTDGEDPFVWRSNTKTWIRMQFP